jgi:hypothetical protein
VSLTAHLLGRHVKRRPGHATFSIRQILLPDRQAKVNDVGPALLVAQEVRRLDVAVNLAFQVGTVQRLCETWATREVASGYESRCSAIRLARLVPSMYSETMYETLSASPMSYTVAMPGG